MDSERVRTMREYVACLYPGDWEERVKNMPANQVMAIFYRTCYKKTKKPVVIEEPKEVQLTIWDILGETGA